MLPCGLRTKSCGLAGWEPPCSFFLFLCCPCGVRVPPGPHLPLYCTLGLTSQVLCLSLLSSPTEFAHLLLSFLIAACLGFVLHCQRHFAPPRCHLLPGALQLWSVPHPEVVHWIAEQVRLGWLCC